MEHGTKGQLFGAWTVGAAGVGVVLIVFGGPLMTVIGVLLVILGLMSLMPTLRYTLIAES